ncbi:hypothetical protein [Paractinoplanes durhamensis]|uniref:hypothetical protein n=1 Tax=Paractinoplanes durhamensis TaxID=113563 RepID=UPI00362F08B4
MSWPRSGWSCPGSRRCGRWSTPAPACSPPTLALPGGAAAETFYDTARPIGYLLFQLTWAVCVVVRVRAASGDEARQLRWFVYAVTVSAAVMLLGFVLWRSPIPGVLAVPLIAAAAGAAIVKYRLYDIDPVINKSLVFGAMALVVTAGYIAVVTGIGSLVDGHGTVLSLIATAVVAVAFEPLRRRVQRLADRLVHGRRVTPYEALARLSAHVTAPLDGICTTVADAIGAREVVLWTGPPEELRAASAWPATAPLPPEPRRLTDLEATPGAARRRFPRRDHRDEGTRRGHVQRGETSGRRPGRPGRPGAGAAGDGAAPGRGG